MSKRLIVELACGLALALSLTVAGCTHTPELFCDEDHPCEDPERPFCDVEGAYPASEGIAKTCIPDPFDASVDVADGGVDASADAAENIDASDTDAPPATHTLTVTVAGTGNGSVVSTPFGINCPGTCEADFVEGTSVTITASADDDSDFIAWSGGGCPTDGTDSCDIVLDADVTVTATLNLKEYDLTVTPGGDGTGGVTSDVAGIDCSSSDTSTGCIATYTHGTAINLTAAPTGASSFGGWSGDCSGMDPAGCSLVMDGPKGVGAAFDLNKFTLSVSVSGPGSVTSGDGLIDCPGDCSESYDSGSTVTLTAHYDSSVTTFDGWNGGGCSGTGATCQVTVTASTSVQATFTPITYDLTVHKTGSDASGGLVTSVGAGINCGTDCSQTYGALTAVSLQASFDPSLTVFGGWSGACTGTNPVICSFSMNSDKDVWADFDVRQYPLTVTVSGSGGTVTSGDGLIDCPTNCNQDYDVGSSVTLTANYNSSVTTFNGWSGGCDTINGDTCQVTVAGTTSVQASFSGVTYDLNVTKTGATTEGRVYSSPAGIDCGSTCQYSFAALTAVALNHEELGDAVFMGWSGACSGSTCNLTMNAQKNVSADFCSPRSCGALECGSVDNGCGGTMNCGVCCTSLSQHACVEEAPSGWVGPVIRWEGAAGDTPPSCSSTSYPSLESDAGWNMSTPGTCGCDCDPATGITCTGTTLLERGGTFCQPVMGGASQAVSANWCGVLTADMKSAEKITFSDSTPSGGSCAEVVTDTLSTATFQDKTRVCSGASSDGICTTAGEVCAPAATNGFDAKLCVFRDNYTGPCPAGDYSELLVRYEGITDTRSCTTCICDDPVGDCNGHLKLKNGCLVSSLTYTEGDAGACLPVSPATYGAYSTIPSGTCTHTGGEVTGSASETGPVTVCCMP